MSLDEPVLLFRKSFGSLRPANKAAEEMLATLENQPMRIRITATRGNTKRNGGRRLEEVWRG